MIRTSFSIRQPAGQRWFWGIVFLSLVGMLASGREGFGAFGFGTPKVLNSNADEDSATDLHPQAATDGTGTWVLVWQSNEGLGMAGSDNDIFVTRSTDDGTLWEYPATLNTNADTDSGEDLTPHLTTDWAGTWIAVWTSDDTLSGTVGSDRDIFFAKSTSTGITWTSVGALNSNAGADAGDDEAPCIATDRSGTWIVVWQSKEDLAGSGTDADIFFSRSTNAGGTWSPPAPLNTNAASDSCDDLAPRIMADASGNWAVVWYSDENLGGSVGSDADIVLSRSTDGGLTWSPPAVANVNAPSDSGADEAPVIVADASGTWLAIWHSFDTLGDTLGSDADILAASSTDTGTTWSYPAPVNIHAATDSGDDLTPSVTTDSAGHWVAVWTSTDDLGGTIGTDSDILSSCSSDGGTTWSAPATVDIGANNDGQEDSDVHPQVTTDSAGYWIAFWASGPGSADEGGNDFDVTAYRSVDNGISWSWKSLHPYFSWDEGADSYPRLATDGAGNWVAAWHSYENLFGTAGIDADIFVCRSADNGSTWTAPAVLNTNAASDNGNDYSPEIASGGSGLWIVVWESFENLGGSAGTDADIFISRSIDNGMTWSPPETLNHYANSDSATDYDPTLATDGLGHWIVTWYSTYDLGGTVGTDRDILYSRSDDNGETWSNAAALNTNAAADSQGDGHQQIATDGAGNWGVVWYSAEILESSPELLVKWDILFSLSVDDGVTWGDPVAVRTTTGSDPGLVDEPQIATDGAGTWVVVWCSEDDPEGAVGTDRDIFVAGSTDNGATWSDPLPLNSNASSDTNDDYDPFVATDGSGTWIAVWSTHEDVGGLVGTDGDIFVSQSLDGGATWTDIEPLCGTAYSDTGDDGVRRPVTDGMGRWLVPWHSSEDLGGAIGRDWDILYSISNNIHIRTEVGGRQWKTYR